MKGRALIMKITRLQLRKLITEVFRDYESEKNIRRAQANITQYEDEDLPDIWQHLKSIEAGGEESRRQASSLAQALGSEEPDVPPTMGLPEYNRHREIIRLMMIPDTPQSSDEIKRDIILFTRYMKNPITFNENSFIFALKQYVREGLISMTDSGEYYTSRAIPPSAV